MSRVRDASPGALAAVIVGLFVLANVLVFIGALVDPCTDRGSALALMLPAAPLLGLAIAIVLARVTSGAWIAIAVGVAVTVLTAAMLLALLALIRAEQCTA